MPGRVASILSRELTAAVERHAGQLARSHALRGEFVYLFARLYATNGHGDRQFSIVIRIGGAPNAEYLLFPAAVPVLDCNYSRSILCVR